METTRRQYTAEFKRDAVALVTEQGYAVTTAARNLGITPKLLSRWKGEQQEYRDAAFPGQGHQPPEQAELRQLREEIRRLRMERDILKKATAFFATHGTWDIPSFTQSGRRIRFGCSVPSCR
jgi:transposase